MGNLDIRDIVEHVDENKNQSLDPKEWKLIANLFGAQPKELKADIQNNFSKDKFMTDEQRKQIALQEQLKGDVKSENKEIKAYNEKLESLKKNLESTKLINTLLGMLWERIKLTNKKEDIQYYKDFLTTVQNNIKDKLPTDDQRGLVEWVKDANDVSYAFEAINKKIEDMITDLSQKEWEFLKTEEFSTNNDVKQTEQSQEVSVWNVDWLKNSLRNLQSNEIIEFKWVIDNLKNGLLTPEKIPQFASMMNILRSMNGLSKDQIMSVVNTTIDTKFADKKDSAEIRLFKDTLSAVLDKWLVWKFVNQVDEDLNKNEKLNWSSYAVLLKPDTNLTSPEAKAGILNIFNNDEVGFNKLVVDFADQSKKTQVEKIIKAYILASIPGGDNPSETDINSATIAIDNNFMVDWSKKPAFIMTKLDWSPLWIAQKDANGDIVKGKEWKDVLSQRFTPFFGDAIHGKKLSPDQYMKPELMQQLLWKDSLKMEWVASVMKELVSINGAPRTFAEAITSLFNSPLFLEIKQAFLSLLAMMGDDVDKQTKYAIEANFAQAERDLSKITETVEDKNGNQISYLKALKALNLDNKDIGEERGNPKERFANAPLENQKSYIAQVIKDPNLRYKKEILDQLGEKVSQSETVASDEDRENKNAVVLVEWKETKIVEHKVIKQWDYYLIDGTPSDGTIFIKDADGKLTKKILKSDNTDFESQDVILTPNESITTLYPKNSESLAQGKEDIFRYYALESSSDLKNPNPIDELLKLEKKPEWIDKIIVTMKKKLTWLDSAKRTKEEIQKIFQEWLNELQWIDTWDNKIQYNTALKKRATAVGIETSNIATVAPKPSDASKKTS